MAAAGLLAVALGVALFPLSRHVVMGLWRNDHFYRGRPTSYWRDKLRENEQRYKRPPSWADQVGDWVSSGKAALGFGRPPDDILAFDLGIGMEGYPFYNCALATFGNDPAAAPVLIRLLDDSEPEIRCNICRALGLINPLDPDAIPALARCLSDEDVFVCASAAWALGQYGPTGKAAVPALVDRLRDRRLDRFCRQGAVQSARWEADARYFASEALKKIDPETARRMGSPFP